MLNICVGDLAGPCRKLRCSSRVGIRVRIAGKIVFQASESCLFSDLLAKKSYVERFKFSSGNEGQYTDDFVVPSRTFDMNAQPFH